MKIERTEIDAPPRGICQSAGRSAGSAGRRQPAIISAMFWRMNDTPMAVIRGASRGACRSGR